jgi:hypothetical protein
MAPEVLVDAATERGGSTFSRPDVNGISMMEEVTSTCTDDS